jgi:hypothetical protein
MATEKVNIDILFETADAASSVRELKTAIRDLKSAAIEAGEGSVEFDKITKKAGELNDQISRVNESISRNTGNAVENAAKGLANFASVGAGAFSAVQGAAVLFGAESKDLQKTLVQLNAAVALTTGLKSLSEAPDIIMDAVKSFGALNIVTKANAALTAVASTVQTAFAAATGGVTLSMNALKVAIASTGIGLLVVGIGLAVTALSSFIDSTDDAAEAQSDLDFQLKSTKDSLDALNLSFATADANNKTAIDAAKARGASLEEINKLELEGFDINAKKIKAAAEQDVINRNNNQSRIDALKQINDLDEDQVKTLLELESKQKVYNAQVLKSYNDVQLLDTQRNTLLLNQSNAISARDKAISDKKIKDAKDAKDKQVKLEKEKNDKLKKEGEDDTQRQEKKALKDLSITEDLLDAELNAYKEFYDKIKKLQETGSENAEKAGIELVRNIKDETANATDGAQVLTEQRLQKVAFFAETARDFTQAFSDFSNTLIDNDINKLNEKYSAQLKNVEQGSEQEKKILAAKAVEEEKIRKKAFIANKAFQIATAVANTALAVTSALANPPGPPATIPLGIIAGTLGAIQIAKIAATSYQNPTLSAGGVGGGGGGAPSIAFPTAPATPSAGALFGTAGAGNTGGGGNAGGGGAVKVFVVESDITNAQRQVDEARGEIRIGDD